MLASGTARWLARKPLSVLAAWKEAAGGIAVLTKDGETGQETPRHTRLDPRRRPYREIPCSKRSITNWPVDPVRG
jgi:hypothetical protein